MLNPDPLRPPDTDGIMPSAAYVEGYDSGFRDAEHLRPRLVQTTAFGCGVVVGMLLAFVLTYAALAAPRSGQTTAPNPQPRDVSAARAVLSAGQSGAPLPPVSVVSAPLPVPTASSAAGEPIPATVSGPATWYDAPTSRDAAAGPALRKALGRHWRGSTVQVCRSSRCVTVVADRLVRLRSRPRHRPGRPRLRPPGGAVGRRHPGPDHRRRRDRRAVDVGPDRATDGRAAMIRRRRGVMQGDDGTISQAELRPHPSEQHAFRTTCLRCGEPATLFVAILAPDERARIEPIPPVDQSGPGVER